MGMRRERGVAGGSAVLLGAVATTSVLNYGLGLALAWLLPADRFGVVGSLITLLLLATSVLAAGFPWALARSLAADGGEDTAPAFRAALVGNVGLGVILAIVFVAIQLPTGALLPGVGPVPTLLAAATIVLLALGSAQVGALQGVRRFDAVAATRVLECVAKVVLVVGAVTATAFGIGGVAAALLVSAAAAAVWSFRSLRDLWPGRGPVAAARTFVDALPLSIATTGFGMLGTLDVLLLGVLGHGAAAAVGIYQAAAIIGRAPFFLGSAVSEAVFPHIARARTLADAHRVTMTALRFIPLALVPAQLVLLVAPDRVLSVVLPAAYADAAGPVRVITLGTIGLLVADVLLKALLARGLGGVVALRVPVAVGVQLVGLAVAVPAFGPLGAAWSFAAGTWAMAALLAGAYLARFRPARAPVPAARWLVALAAPTGAFLAAEHSGTFTGTALVLLGLAAYVALALRLGLVPPEVLAHVRRRTRATPEARS